jgi:LPS export ABC transporter protein LptC
MLAQQMILVAIASSLCLSATEITDRPSEKVEMGGVTQVRYDREGNVAARIAAERAHVDEEGILHMEDVNSTIYRENEEIEILASKGQMNTEGTGDALFEGEIELLMPDFVVTTSRASYRESDQTVRGDEKIALEGPTSRVVGSGFVMYTSENMAIIYKPRGIIRFGNVEKQTESRKSQEIPEAHSEEEPDPSGTTSDEE